MFDNEFTAGIRGIKIKSQEREGVYVRTCTLSLEREFDDTIAAGLGAEAKKALSCLKSGGMRKCELPLDAVNAAGTLVAATGETVEIGVLAGVKATCSVDPEGEFPPSVVLDFEFSHTREAWAFFGDHCGGRCSVTLIKRQGSLISFAGKGASA